MASESIKFRLFLLFLSIMPSVSKKPVLKSKSLKIRESAINLLRIPTGIPGFDELVEGGFPERQVIMLTGSCGTGKSTFAMNFLVNGALNGETGVYVSLEENIEDNIKEMALFGWPIDSLMREKKLVIIKPELYDFEKLVESIEDIVSKLKAKRLVVDSSSLIGLYFKDAFKVRKAMVQLNYVLKKVGCTSVVISEIKENEQALSTYGVEEFVADGVIVLYCQKKENLYTRALAIRKMRSTNHSMRVHPMQIKRPGGITVFASEEVFNEF